MRPSCQILSVQDCQTSQELLRLALSNLPDDEGRFELMTANRPSIAKALLSEPSRSLPQLILMSWEFINGETGAQFLRAVKANPAWAPIPVLVLTSGLPRAAKQQIYEDQAACVLESPADWHGWVTVAERIQQFWHTTSTSPSPRRACISTPSAAAPTRGRLLAHAAGR